MAPGSRPKWVSPCFYGLLAITDRYRELPAWITGLARPSPAAEDLALLRTLTSLR